MDREAASRGTRAEHMTRGGALLWEAWRERRQIDALPADCRPASPPRTLDEAYAVQDGLAASAGLAVAGYKIGATNAQVQARFGVDAPFSGRLFADYVGGSPLTVPANTVNFYAIEAEFDFVMGRALAPRDAPYTQGDVRAAVASVHPAIEVPDSRYTDWLSMKAPDLIGDNAIGCLLCLGPPGEGGLDRDLAGQPVIVRVNGEVASEGAGSNVLGDPWNVMVWLAPSERARPRAGRGHGDHRQRGGRGASRAIPSPPRRQGRGPPRRRPHVCWALTSWSGHLLRSGSSAARITRHDPVGVCDVDGRNESGHDVEGAGPRSTSRRKPHVFTGRTLTPSCPDLFRASPAVRLVGGWALHYARTTLWACATWMAGTSPAMT